MKAFWLLLSLGLALFVGRPAAAALVNVRVWGDNSYAQWIVPEDLTNAVAVAAGHGHIIALRSDGTVTAWGDNLSGQSDVPNGLTNVIAIYAAGSYSAAVTGHGNLVFFGVGCSRSTSTHPLPPWLMRLRSLDMPDWYRCSKETER